MKMAIYQCNCCMQTNILFTARIIASMIYYIEIIVVSRPMIFHNYNTCTSLLQYAHTHAHLHNDKHKGSQCQ